MWDEVLGRGFFNPKSGHSIWCSEDSGRKIVDESGLQYAENLDGYNLSRILGIKNPKVEAGVSGDRLQVVFDGEIFYTGNLYEEVHDDVKVNFTPSKVEIRMQKKSGEMWPQLEAPNSEEIKKPVASTKNKWDMIDVDETENGDDAGNAFKRIYSELDDDSKKAMMKSYYESAGTVLSTRWDEIKSKKTEISPPDGMEFKKW